MTNWMFSVDRNTRAADLRNAMHQLNSDDIEVRGRWVKGGDGKKDVIQLYTAKVTTKHKSSVLPDAKKGRGRRDRLSRASGKMKGRFSKMKVASSKGRTKGVLRC